MAYGPRELIGITREAFAAHSARDPGYVVRVAESLACIGVEDRRTLRKRLAALGATDAQIDDALVRMRSAPPTAQPVAVDELRAFALSVWLGERRALLDDEQFGRMALATRLVALMAWHAWEAMPALSQAQRIEAIGAALDGDARLPKLSIDVIEKAVKRYVA